MQTLVDQLVRLAIPTGGWGYVPGQQAHIEPTCLALLALKPFSEQTSEVWAAARGALAAFRREDGSYRLPRGRLDAVWGTAMALFTESILRSSANIPPSEKESAQYLISQEGHAIRDDPEVADMSDIDSSLVGWPWAEGNFSWVEPTSWACLALGRVGQADHPRVLQAETLLNDRAFDQGGINYGNRRILGRMTEPIPTPTALMLLAMQHHPELPRIQKSIAYLESILDDSQDPEHLAWGILALSIDSSIIPDVKIQSWEERLRQTLRQRMENAWYRESTTRIALALLALNHRVFHPFRSPRIAPQAHLESRGRATKREPLSERMRSGFRAFLRRGLEGLRQPPVTSRVHIAQAKDYEADLLAILNRQFEHFRDELPLAGKKVVIKPNLVEYHKDKVINTHPKVIGALIDLCQAEGASEIIVAEGPGHWRNLEFLADASGLAEELQKRRVPLVDLNHDEPVKTANLGRLTGLDYLYLPRTITSAEVLISVPKMKTHHWAAATLSLKNLFGIMPGICYGWPKNELHWRGIPQSIIDIALTQTPQLAIVDGIIGMENDGPLNGTPKAMGVLVMGNDLVAVDATCCRMMGLPPERVPYLILGASKKLGRLDDAQIEQRGDAIADHRNPFAPPPRLEKILAPTSA